VRAPHPVDASRPVVLAVGDSYTEALHVDDSEVFTARLERTLGGGVQVLDVGHSGFSAADYLALAGRYEELFHPRWTIVTLKGEDFEGVERGVYRLARAGDELVSRGTPPPPMSPRLAPVRLHVALYSFAVYRWHQLLAGAAAEPPLFLGGKVIPAARPSPAPVASAHELLAALARAYDHRVTFVFLPRPGPGHEPPPPAEEAFAAACAEQGLSCVNPRTRFQTLVDAGTPAYGFANSVPNTGHMNARGHAVLADALAEELGRLALL
jgi:hypothetical protein